jgi:protein-L-isoaspartate O-methyltransferase
MPSWLTTRGGNCDKMGLPMSMSFTVMAHVAGPNLPPFDAITVAAGGTEIPSPLFEQSCPGGRLVIPLGRPNSVQKLVRIRQTDQHDDREEKLADLRFVPLVDGPATRQGLEP